jgi:hypothetical protein
MTTAQMFEFRPAGERDVVPSAVAQTELARQFGLDRLPEQRTLVCYWHRDRKGRLTGVWEADIGLVPRL